MTWYTSEERDKQWLRGAGHPLGGVVVGSKEFANCTRIWRGTIQDFDQRYRALDSPWAAFSGGVVAVAPAQSQVVDFIWAGDIEKQDGAFDEITALRRQRTTLQSRVQLLEKQLQEMRQFWPAIKALVEETATPNDGLTAMLGCMLPVDLNADWEEAIKKDALSSPPDEDYEAY